MWSGTMSCSDLRQSRCTLLFTSCEMRSALHPMSLQQGSERGPLCLMIHLEAVECMRWIQNRIQNPESCNEIMVQDFPQIRCMHACMLFSVRQGERWWAAPQIRRHSKASFTAALQSREPALGAACPVHTGHVAPM